MKGTTKILLIVTIRKRISIHACGIRAWQTKHWLLMFPRRNTWQSYSHFFPQKQDTLAMLNFKRSWEIHPTYHGPKRNRIVFEQQK